MVSIEDLKIGTVIDIHDPFSFDDKHRIRGRENR